MKKREKLKRISLRRELIIWSATLVVSFIAIWHILPPLRVLAAVTNNGIFFWGDLAAGSQGVLRAATFTSPSTAGSEFNGATASTTSFILHTIAKTAPTREEMMIGGLKVDGALDIQSCTTGCDANGDFTAQWNNPGTSATQDCNNTVSVFDVCVRPYDITYESLSGRGFVAYADNVTDKFYYALWDGSAWSPDSTPGSPSATNEVDFDTGGTGGTPSWIRVIAAGENLDSSRSNRVMVLIADNNNDLWACYWDGSTFSCTSSAIEASLANCSIGQCMDGAWQDNNTFILIYGDSTSTIDLSYQKYTVGSGWGAEQQLTTLTNVGEWVTAAKSPISSRILMTTSEQDADTRSAVWRGDDATDGWTVCSITDCPDLSTGAVTGSMATTAFERFSGEGLHIYNDNSAASSTDYSTFTPSGSWGTVTSATITTSDDDLSVKAWGSPNSDDIMAMVADVDCDTYARLWDGSAWQTEITDLEIENSMYGTTCPELAAPGAADPRGGPYNYSFAWKMYTPWQRNWKFYLGSDTASTPTDAYAAENTAPTGFSRRDGVFRLRMNYSERGTLSSADSRKKLQYTSGCNPNSALETTCTWTDVDDPGGSGIWRYKDITCTATDCADNTVLTGTVLTGTDGTCTVGNGCGTWIMDKDSATVTNMDHNGSKVQESEWVVESNGAAASTTYYFRIYNVEQETPIYREQDSSDCGAGAAACTYSSLTTSAATPTVDQALRHGNWFTGGVEQGFAWAD